ncbi:hypothetical protein ACN50G_06450 [Lentilactobacillus buchneri]|uniref:D-alanyl-D-alanine carboxypeptidase n=2 Tax=Lentilactobacillus buchneri TaxID=1581 RepID=A0A4R5NRI5_LENBU|nr:hypothetical protein [Lentilactobacillus buchneri]KRK68697.1 hypothetical protein FC79_GL000242 [Lentilactobacillus buchneri DSM 20057]MCT3251925.1 hypothetical protein [Lentilactobacillus buchneri]MCT3546513.1 hypothetical protein [Lentilactobacillus buchneri]MCT4437103.1 hypothetical protein [Lentilactobacillus buchneri]MQM71672.1 hypothetical protein [Lentilactobacillus buchneri]
MKKVLMLITLSFAFLIGGVGSQTVDAVKQPQSAFKNIKYINDFNYNKFSNVAVHAKNIKKNAYIWNDTHTKKLYNLKNYPTYTWFKTATGSYKGNNNWIQVTNYSTMNSKRGWIWKGYLKAGFNPTGYQILQKRYGQPQYAGGQYHVASGQKNVYLWNWSHTKVRANLKHYTNQTFSRRHSILVSHNGNQQWYYYTDVDTKNGTISGYVKASQMAKGRSKNYHGNVIVYPSEFDNTSDYLSYIKDNNHQKLVWAIIKLFPNTPVDYQLSYYAAVNYGIMRDPGWDGDDFDPDPVKGYSDIVSFKPVINYLMSHRNESNAQKLAGVKKLLAKAGYTQEKRDELSGYRLGIYMLNNVKDSASTKSTSRINWYGLIIGKPNE